MASQQEGPGFNSWVAFLCGIKKLSRAESTNLTVHYCVYVTKYLPIKPLLSLFIKRGQIYGCFLGSTFFLLLTITIEIKICKGKQRQKSAFLHLLKIVVVSEMEEKGKNVPERPPYKRGISIAHYTVRKYKYFPGIDGIYGGTDWC